MNDVSYRSFVIRVWARATAKPSTRVEIEQVQTGAGAVLRDAEAERLARAVEEPLQARDQRVRAPRGGAMNESIGTRAEAVARPRRMAGTKGEPNP